MMIINDERAANLWDVRDVAAYLKCSARKVWGLDSSGQLPRSARIGRAVRWTPAHIERWVELGCPDRKTFESRLTAETAPPSTRRGR